jgi:proteasome accessory factor C
MARPAKVSERLRRLLAVVPYVVQHPGVRVDELSRLFDVPEGELAADLDLLFMSGLPPYGPGDLIEVQVEDGRVWISMADYFARPLRLTRSEALALYLEGKALLGTPGLPEAAALESALGKLEAALGPESLGGLAGRVEAAEPDDAPTGLLAEFREAAAGHRRLEIEYYAASTAETTVREVDPESVFSALGRWYVVAFDHRSEEERMFRLDRIRRAEPTGDSFEPRGLAGAGRPLYTRSGEDIEVRLRLAPGARWVAEYYVTDHVAERGDGSVDVTIPTKRLGWVARLVLRLGDAVEILAPDKLREGVRRAAGATLSAYGDVTP